MWHRPKTVCGKTCAWPPQPMHTPFDSQHTVGGQTIDEDDFDHTSDLQREFYDCTVSCTLDAC